MTILFHDTALELSLPVAAALVAFAGRDETRAHLGVGIDYGSVCATDGHVLLRFDADCSVLAESAHARTAKDLHGKVWPRAYVETAIKVARAQKSKSVRLEYSALGEGKFPPVSQVVPDYGVEPSKPIGFNPDYVGQLSAVAKACGNKIASLVAARGPLDPLGFRIAGHGLSALAVVMPARL